MESVFIVDRRISWNCKYCHKLAKSCGQNGSALIRHPSELELLQSIYYRYTFFVICNINTLSLLLSFQACGWHWAEIHGIASCHFYPRRDFLGPFVSHVHCTIVSVRQYLLQTGRMIILFLACVAGAIVWNGWFFSFSFQHLQTPFQPFSHLERTLKSTFGLGLQ